MAGLPMGVRFHPTKLQLVDYFLRIKHSGQELPECYPQFLDFDVYSDHPFNILNSTKERRGVNDVKEGFFFCQLNKLTPNGKRISRSIKGIGTWSEKSKTTDVYNGNRVVGIEKYLKFKPDGKSNNNNNEDEWLMHQYSRLRNDDEEEDEMVVLCHITKKPVSTKRRMIMPMDYEASSSKRGRTEYEQPLGFNNSGIINPNHQDYVSRGVDEGCQVEYCGVPQGNINSVVVEESNEALTTKEKEGTMMLDYEDATDKAYVEDLEGMIINQANYEVDDGILQLAELDDHQVYDKEPLQEQAEDTNQFLQDAEEADSLPTGDSLTAGFDSTTNELGFGDLDQLDLSMFDAADVRWLLETPITA